MKAIRASDGVISLSISAHLPASDASISTKPVALRPGRATVSTKPLPTGSDTSVNTTGIVRVSRNSAAVAGVVTPIRRSGWCSTSSFGVPRHAAGLAGGAAIFDSHIGPADPAQLRESLRQRDGLALSFRVVLAPPGQHTDAPDTVRALPTRRKRRRDRAGERRDERPPPHCITPGRRRRLRRA